VPEQLGSRVSAVYLPCTSLIRIPTLYAGSISEFALELPVYLQKHIDRALQGNDVSWLDPK
jgi:hypothetical protein